MATSKFTRKFELANGVPLLGAIVYLVPQSGTYPTDALLCTEHATRQGIYYREALPDGEYKIYIGTGGNAPAMGEEKYWVGEQRITDITTSLAGVKSVSAIVSGDGYKFTFPALSNVIAVQVQSSDISDDIVLSILGSSSFDILSSVSITRNSSFYKSTNLQLNDSDAEFTMEVSAVDWHGDSLKITLIYV